MIRMFMLLILYIFFGYKFFGKIERLIKKKFFLLSCLYFNFVVFREVNFVGLEEVRFYNYLINFYDFWEKMVNFF